MLSVSKIVSIKQLWRQIIRNMHSVNLVMNNEIVEINNK